MRFFLPLFWEFILLLQNNLRWIKSNSRDCIFLFITITCFAIFVAHERFSIFLSTFICMVMAIDTCAFCSNETSIEKNSLLVTWNINYAWHEIINFVMKWYKPVDHKCFVSINQCFLNQCKFVFLWRCDTKKEER